MCPAAKSGNQRSAISHNSVAHKWHWTLSVPIRTLVLPVSVLSRVHCSYVVCRVVCLWSCSDWPLYNYRGIICHNHDLPENFQSGADLSTFVDDMTRQVDEIILYLIRFHATTQTTYGDNLSMPSLILSSQELGREPDTCEPYISVECCLYTETITQLVSSTIVAIFYGITIYCELIETVIYIWL